VVKAGQQREREREEKKKKKKTLGVAGREKGSNILFILSS
jgi:hypothetical protein